MNSPADTLAAGRYPVRLVALRTGLTPHLLRAWERRYAVVTPRRSEGGQRLYSDLDIERLARLKRLVEGGHAIGRIASLPLDALAQLELEAGPPVQDAAGIGRVEDEGRAGSIQGFNDAALRATLNLDAGRLQEVLERAAVTLGVPAFLETVAVTTLEDIGHGWRERSVTVAQEHLATAVFRRVLGWLLAVNQTEADAHRLIVATPPGERHELGALMAAILAAVEGWQVTYLGADMPVDELVAAVGQTQAKAVALSLVGAGDERGALKALREIRAGLPPGVALLLGGAGARGVHAKLDDPGVHLTDSLADLRPARQRLVAVPQA